MLNIFHNKTHFLTMKKLLLSPVRHTPDLRPGRHSVNQKGLAVTINVLNNDDDIDQVVKKIKLLRKLFFSFFKKYPVVKKSFLFSKFLVIDCNALILEIIGYWGTK